MSEATELRVGRVVATKVPSKFCEQVFYNRIDEPNDDLRVIIPSSYDIDDIHPDHRVAVLMRGASSQSVVDIESTEPMLVLDTSGYFTQSNSLTMKDISDVKFNQISALTDGNRPVKTVTMVVTGKVLTSGESLPKKAKVHINNINHISKVVVSESFGGILISEKGWELKLREDVHYPPSSAWLMTLGQLEPRLDHRASQALGAYNPSVADKERIKYVVQRSFIEPVKRRVSPSYVEHAAALAASRNESFGTLLDVSRLIPIGEENSGSWAREPYIERIKQHMKTHDYDVITQGRSVLMIPSEW